MVLTLIPDISTPEFPGIFPGEVGYIGPHPDTRLHPHMRLNETMTSMPTVRPGDMVFWHSVRFSSPYLTILTDYGDGGTGRGSRGRA